MILHEVLLLCKIQYRQWFQLPVMRPAFLIHHGKFIIAAGRQQRTDCHVHQILFLFFAEFRLEITYFLYPDQEQDGLHIRLFPKPLHQLFLKCPPPALNIILHIHPAKIAPGGIYPFRG